MAASERPRYERRSPSGSLEFHSKRAGAPVGERSMTKTMSAKCNIPAETPEPPALNKVWRSRSSAGGPSLGNGTAQGAKAAVDEYLQVPVSDPDSISNTTQASKSKNSLSAGIANLKFKRTESAVVEELLDPLPPLESALDETDLKEAAYELLVGLTGARADLKRSNSGNLATKTAEKETRSSRLRMALGLRATGDEKPTVDAALSTLTPMETVCRQMGISDFSDQRTRKALSRASASQVGRKIENLIAPLELLQYLGPTDFASQRDYMRWKRRQVALLEQGLLCTPVGKSDGQDAASQKLRKILTQAQNGEIDLQDGQTKQALRVAVLSKAESHGKGWDSRQSAVHWADGYPFNIALYEALLRAVFDSSKESELVAEVEGVLEQVRKAWSVLGINPILHHLSFSWVLFRQFVKTGKKEVSLVSAAEAQIREAIRLFKEDPQEEAGGVQREVETALLKSYMGSMQAFAEKRLFAYREAFPDGARGVMEHLVAISLLAEEILQSEAVQGYQPKNRKRTMNPAQEKAETFIRSSVKQAFAQIHEQATSRRRSFKGKEGIPPILVSLAVDAGELAGDEVSLYCPAFKEWCASAGGVAAATVHGCYKRELKQYLTETKLLTQEAAQVLLAADRLEKQLVQMAVEDGEDCEDGGAAAIRDMPPYETEAAMQGLLNHWVEDRLAKFGEWVDRTVEQEKWDPNALKEHHAPSAVDVMRLLEETMEAFFELPLPPNGDVLVHLAHGMEGAIERYCAKATESIGSKEQFLPPLPPLTRYKKDVFLKAQQALPQPPLRRPGPGGGGGALPHGKPATPQPTAGAVTAKVAAKLEGISLPAVCCRINTLRYCKTATEGLVAQIRTRWEHALAPAPPSPATGTRVKPQGIKAFFTGSKEASRNIPLAPPLPSEMLGMFESVKEKLELGVSQLCEVAAYKVVFHDMRAVVLEGLYLGGVPKARVATVIDALRPHLISIVDNIAGPMRDRLVAALLRALVAAMLRVLLAGGGGRAYAVTDAGALENDLQELKDLFVDGGEGLPEADVNKATALLSQILHLFSCDTDDLVRNFEAAHREWLKTQGGAAATNKEGTRPKLPPTKEDWKPTDANTLLRVLCYRADRKASKVLKKIFDLPKEARR